MKILMFGWEFPPNNMGGLGTACFGLTKGLTNSGHKVVFVLPKGSPSHPHLSIISTSDLTIDNENLRVRYVNSLLMPYMGESDYDAALRYNRMRYSGGQGGELYGRDLFEEVHRFAEKAGIVAQFEDFDVIHCHDWMTFKAGINAKKVSGKPLVVHVHATEFDRTGGNVNQYVYDMEREGMHAADKVIAVSNFTKSYIVDKYGVRPDKVEVVHNAVIKNKPIVNRRSIDGKTVLFLGRITLQKGPDYFVEAANNVLKVLPDTKFIVAGSGDMYPRMVDRVAELGISRNVLFTGHLRGEEVDRAYQSADLYVMPSVSEPFGITPLEALKNGTPVLISKQSGVSEVLNNALKVDFWDINEMTNKIVGVLAYNNLKSSLIENGERDLDKMSWDHAADKCYKVYESVAR